MSEFSGTESANEPGLAPSTHREPEARAPEPRLVATAAWLGLMVGLIEVGVLLFQVYQNRVATIGALRLNQHFPWMIPVAHLAIFVAFGLALELFDKVRPNAGRHISSLVLGSLVILELLLTIRVLSTIACVLLGCGIASNLVPRLARYQWAFQRLVRASLVPLAAGLVLIVIGRHAQLAMVTHHSARKPAAAGSPNVLFLVLDTVRARSLGLYGYDRDTSPNLDKMGRSGVMFAEARSTAPWTLPSHAGMFTGRLPGELFQYHEQKLDASVPTLAGYLGRNGYATGGFVANTFYCNSGFGLSSGFDHYEDFDEISKVSPTEILRNAEVGRRLIALVGDEQVEKSVPRKDADRINSDFLNWLPTRGDRPFFAFLNYIDAHAPYFLPLGPRKHFGINPTTPAEIEEMTVWHRREWIPDDPRPTLMARDMYDDCIAYLDESLGRLFEEMKKRDLLKNTLVIITADHGEEIGEHKLVGHGRSLYRDEVHVPLLVVRPGQIPSGAVVPEPVSLRDLPATVVELLGLQDGSPFPGRSLAPYWSTPPDMPRPEPGLVRSEVAIRRRSDRNGSRPPAIRGPMVSVVAEGLTYIRDAQDNEELYRLREDPAQANNLAGDPALRPALERLRALAGPMDSP